MSFKRVIEDFICGKCGATVKGGGYTNHCPRCLWSKHVDVFPGDRAAECGGMMEPVEVEGASPNYRILHRCTRCGHEQRNKVTPADDTNTVLAIARTPRLP